MEEMGRGWLREIGIDRNMLPALTKLVAKACRDDGRIKIASTMKCRLSRVQAHQL
jgi:hypothetical protein